MERNWILCLGLLTSLLFLAPSSRDVAAASIESRDIEAARQGWLEIVRSLEQRRLAAPDDAVLLQNLIVAYTHLNVLERSTPRGNNLCRLIPLRLQERRRLPGLTTPEEDAVLSGCESLLAFEWGLYPLVGPRLVPSGEEVSTVLSRAMRAIGQRTFDRRPGFTVRCGAAPLRVGVWSLGGSAPDADVGTVFHHYFLPAFDESQGLPRFWMTLASERVGISRRFYLYAHQGYDRKPLRIYGTREPAYDELTGDVTAVIKRMAGDMFQPAGIVGRRRTLLPILLVGTVLILIGFRAFRGRFSTPAPPRVGTTALAIGLPLLALALVTAAVAEPKSSQNKRSDRLEFPPEAQEFLGEVSSHLARAGVSLSTKTAPAAESTQGPVDPPTLPEPPADPLPWQAPVEPQIPSGGQAQPLPVGQERPLPEDPQRRLAQQFAIIDHTRGLIADARKRGRISEELAAELTGTLQGWKIAQEKLQENPEHKLDIKANLSELIAAQEAGMSASGQTASGSTEGSSEQAPPQEAAVGLLQQVYEGTGSSAALASEITVKPAYSTSIFQIKPRDVDDSAPLIARYHPDRIQVPIPQPQEQATAGLVARGVRMDIDEDLLRGVFARQGWDSAVEEVALLEDSLLNARSGAEAAKAVDAYLVARQQRFLDLALEKFSTIEKPVLVRLGPLLEQLRSYQARWDDRPPPLRTIGDLTSINGFLLDPEGNDLWLVGERVPGRTPISVDCLIVGLQKIWRARRSPICSLDSPPSAIAGVQRSRLVDVPGDSEFGRIMLDADYAMKRILFRDDDLGISGFEPLEKVFEKLAADGEISGHNRFWLTAQQPNERSVLLGPYGLSALFDIRVRVETEELVIVGDDAVGTGKASDLRAADAQSFTDHFPQIAERRPIFRQLESLYQIAMLARCLRLAVPGDLPVLSGLADLPYERVSVPETYPGLRLQHRRGDLILEISGGCDLNPRASTRTLLQGTSASHVALTGAVAQGGQQSNVLELHELQLMLPAGEEGRDDRRVYRAAIQDLAEENWADARKALAGLIDRSPSWAELYERRAMAHWHLGDWRAALWDAAMAIRLEPEEPEFRATWFYLRLEGGDERAVAELSPELRERLSNRYVARGYADEFEKDRPERAALAFDRALQLKPENADALSFRGMKWLRTGDFGFALSDFDAALRIQPRDSVIRCLRGSTKSRVGDRSGAMADYDEVLRESPDQYLGYAFRADLRGQMEDFEGAIRDASRAIELRPDLAAPYVTRGSSRASLADARPQGAADLWRTAKEDLQRALDLFPPEEPMRPAIESLLREIEQHLQTVQ